MTPVLATQQQRTKIISFASLLYLIIFIAPNVENGHVVNELQKGKQRWPQIIVFDTYHFQKETWLQYFDL